MARFMLYYVCPKKKDRQARCLVHKKKRRSPAEHHTNKEFFMKKAVIAVAIAFLVAGAAFAQPFAPQSGPWTNPRGMSQWNTPGYGRGYNYPAQALPALEKISLEGNLELVDTRIAIKKDDKTYFVMIPNRLYGFVDGLKEGASVKIDGYSHEIVGLKDSYALRADSLSLNGKTIDLSAAAAGFGRAGGMAGGMMGGRAKRGGQFGFRR